MKLKQFITIFICALSLQNYAQIPSAEHITLENTTSVHRKDETVEIKLNDLKNKDFSTCLVTHIEKEIPFQFEDMNNDGKPENILIATDFSPNEKKEILIHFDKTPSKDFNKRTQAVLGVKQDYILRDSVYTGGRFVNVNETVVPDNHTAHDALYRFEGPGWESDKIGYRFYLDDRNRTDIFGKKTNELVLQHVGMNDLLSDSKESYTKMSDWGMDIFKVGSSLGIGSIAMWHNNIPVTVSETEEVSCRISSNGPLKSGVTTTYKNWLVDGSKYDLVSDISITAGSRLSKVDLLINTSDTMCTGIAKYKGTDFFQQKNKNGWSFIALYGKQTLAEDKLGLAVFYRSDQLVKVTEDDASHIIVLKPENKLSYYFAAAWEQEPDGITSRKEFEEYLNNIIIQLNNPVNIEFASGNSTNRKAVLDNYFNNEFRKDKEGKEQAYHYTWEDEAHTGYSELGKVLKSLNAEISILRHAPSKANLDDADLYIIVDPDTPKENPRPNYIDQNSINIITSWVKDGGILCLLGNDAGNCEFENFNKLASVFGIRFNEDSRNKVDGEKYDMGKFDVLPDHPVFQGVNKIYMKEVSTLNLDGSAKPILTEGGDVIMAGAEYGKGFVFAVGDPWIYNEYIDNSRLPSGFTNKIAAENLFRWLLEKSVK